MLNLYFIAIIAFVATIGLMLVAMPLARRFSLVDQPTERKKHDGAIPLIGGLVLVPVFLISCFLVEMPPSFLLLVPAVLLLLLLGALDDRFHVRANIRFAVQAVVALYAVIICDAQLHHLGDLLGFGKVGLSWFSIPFFTICLLLLMNSINMIDGVDGLSGGFLVVVSSILMLAVGTTSPLFGLLLILVACLLGFLIFNMRHPLRKRASVFMGDAGSMSLALVIAWFVIQAVQEKALVPISIAWLLALPVIDTFFLFFIRYRQGRSPFSADRLHFHYLLIDNGLLPTKTTYGLMAIAVVSGSVGLFGTWYGVPEYILFYIWVALTLGYTAIRFKKG